MGRDEVLQYVQTFPEVGGNRRLDNRAIRLCHQSTHSSQLTNLSGRASRTRIGVHVHRVKGRLLFILALAVGHGLFRQARHHGLGYLIVSSRPDIDDLVVLLALGHQTGTILLLDFGYLALCAGNELGFRLGNREVINADRGT